MKKFILAMLVLLATTAQSYSSETSEFSSLWERYVENCGAIIKDTEGAVTNFPLSEPNHIQGISENGTRLLYGWANRNSSSSSSVEMGISDASISTICGVGRYSKQIDPEIETKNLKKFVEDNAALEYKGGKMNFPAGTKSDIQGYTGGANSYSFNVYNVFPEEDIISIVDIRNREITIFHMVVFNRLSE